jgi:hypothetical protein
MKKFCGIILFAFISTSANATQFTVKVRNDYDEPYYHEVMVAKRDTSASEYIGFKREANFSYTWDSDTKDLSDLVVYRLGNGDPYCRLLLRVLGKERIYYSLENVVNKNHVICYPVGTIDKNGNMEIVIQKDENHDVY